jgi:AdoMet-dependent heme synthase
VDCKDFSAKPVILIWEVTQACDLACVHCRASAQPLRSARELTSEEARGLIDQVAGMQVPVFVMTGGDPLKRADLPQLVSYASATGVRPSLAPSVTPLLTRGILQGLKDRGLSRIALSLDGSTPAVHDSFRQVNGAFDRTVRAIRWARECGLPVQVNTSMTRRNLGELEAVAQLLSMLDIVLWSVFFLVPTGRGQAADLITAAEFEQCFARLYKISARSRFHVKTTEAPHYRRYVFQQRSSSQDGASAPTGPGRESPPPLKRAGPVNGARDANFGEESSLPRSFPSVSRHGINDAKGFVFVSHTGEVFPSGFLPISAGNLRRQPLAEIYRHSPLLTGLRDSDRLKGKCAVCEFRQLCGGSRARAYALTGDPYAPEPRCSYVPPRWLSGPSLVDV